MEEKESRTKKRKRRKKRVIFILPLLITAVVIGSIYAIHQSQFQSTDDAYVETHSVQIAPKVSGHVVDMLVEDNQFVKEGALLAKIDSTDYKVKLAESGAKYDAALYRQKAAKAAYDASTSEIELAKKNLDRYTVLYKDGAVSKQEYDNAKTTYDNANARLTTARENLLSSQSNRVADAELKQLAAQKQQASLNLGYTKIYAPQSGYVTNKTIEKGSYVQVGQPLFVIVPDNVWIVANFKENQLTNMKIGQSVDIEIDAYPGKVFKGKIDSIQKSSGAKASLFPPENAVGSFVKIVQRIPVKIVFAEQIDHLKYNIIPGMSVIPKVRVK